MSEKPYWTAREHAIQMNMTGAGLKERMMRPKDNMTQEEHEAYLRRLAHIAMDVACHLPDPVVERKMHDRAVAEGYRAEWFWRSWLRWPRTLYRRIRESVRVWVWHPARAWALFKLRWRRRWFGTSRRYFPSLLRIVGGSNFA